MRSAPFVELLEWDIPEISMSDTSDGIKARRPIFLRSGQISWAVQEWRMLDGSLIREAGRRHSGVSHIHADHLPRYENGRIKSNYIFQLLNDVLNLFDSHEQYNLAHKIMIEMAEPGARLRVELPAAREIVSNDRAEALAITERILSRLVLVDGVLWKRTSEPLLKVSNKYLQLDCTINYNEGDENRSAAEELRPGEFMLPLVDWQRVAFLEQRKGLPPLAHGVVDSVAADAPVTRDTDLWLAQRAATYLVDKTAACIGDRTAEAVRLWVDLRDMASAGAAVTPSELLESIEFLRNSTLDRKDPINEQLQAMLDPLDLGDQQATRPSIQRAIPRR
ncbi:hypothetical protein HFO56_02040 [Rhizobium laguerreae]|uniref:hypothetical protein n=1 Tax=Rhizobium laguerreae TaxID=1076926 RepID=UPI001C90B57A|nr:hypothetical protein [Rhizobium laguerreae]MBY3151188.1 hypothetical protein [Rhizobium laguerreae]